ncbi:TatD DNase family protein [Desulfovibrio intestinalis]|uniref:TatD DNase family protein n=2 Tax=Desulfovibrio intestinalis TaxID=58621 RepID=A0A7W8C313_9BACT|nr:TatD DNase family protein [Desulfovibrio intestinalis]
MLNHTLGLQKRLTIVLLPLLGNGADCRLESFAASLHRPGLPLPTRIDMYRREVSMSKKSVDRIDPVSVALPLEGVDSHAHLDGEEFDQDRESVLERARACGVAHVGNVFLGPEDFNSRRHYFADHPEVFFLLGIHPCHGQDCTPDTLEAMRRAFREEPRLKAVGEIGLDFYWDDCPREVQYETFSTQLRLAREVERPVVIHCREAEEETLMVLESQGFKDYPLLWHCFGKGPDLAQRIIRNGWHISVPGPVTYKANEDLRQAVTVIPAARLMLETDAPYLAPLPWRGKRNEPAFTVFTARTVAETRGEEPEDLWRMCGQNARRFFGV